MKFREHRGSLTQSMETVVELPATREALADLFNAKLANMSVSTIPDDVVVEYYTEDTRIGWSTYIVVVKGYGVFGFTDTPLDLQDGDTLSKVQKDIMAMVPMPNSNLDWMG